MSSAAAGLGEKRRVYRYASSGAEWGEKAAPDPVLPVRNSAPYENRRNDGNG